MSSILITGGTGLVGKSLTKYLVSKGHQVIILTRSFKKTQSQPAVEYALWDVKMQTIDVAAVQKADYIMHLAGAGVVEKKWTEAYKKEILESRTQSSKLLVDTLKNNSHSVKAIISSSAIGWYGEDQTPGFAFTETDAADEGFLGQTCLLWEQSIEQAEGLGIRVCKLRTGIVLSNDGGALLEFKKPIELGVGAILGSGKQIVSWIHIDDLCRLFLYAAENEQMQGSYNAVAPKPVSNKILTLQLAKLMKGNFYVPLHVPAFMLKIILGSRSIEVLKSTTVSCTKIKEEGFIFLYPTIDAALQELIKKDDPL
jgi:uncharacterized protein (TIGR01777 family)